jgi:hypothetical protein
VKKAGTDKTFDTPTNPAAAKVKARDTKPSNQHAPLPAAGSPGSDPKAARPREIKTYSNASSRYDKAASCFCVCALPLSVSIPVRNNKSLYMRFVMYVATTVPHATADANETANMAAVPPREKSMVSPAQQRHEPRSGRAGTILE